MRLNNPVVSIITPSYNRAGIVHETAASIFNQSYSHWEWIIVDDGSIDNSMEVLQQFASGDSRVRLYQRDRDPKGACTCRNIAVEKCSGDYVLFLDTDDLLAPFCLEQRVKAAQEMPEADFIMFPMLLFKQQPYDLGLLWNIENGRDDIERLLYGDPIIQGTGTLWKKEAFVNIGMWNEQLLLWQDIDLHLRSLIKGVPYFKRMELKPDIFLRISDVSLSRTGYHSLPKLNSRVKVFTSAAESLKEKQNLNRYLGGLRYMLLDLFLNAANTNHFSLTEKLTASAVHYNLFSPAEVKQLKTFARIRKWRLYKIPAIQNFWVKKIRALSLPCESSLGKIKYTETPEAKTEKIFSDA
jgi:glycosyltransferase involved in cell wall biosynthesis